MLILDNTTLAVWFVLVYPASWRMTRRFLALAAAQAGGLDALDARYRATLFRPWIPTARQPRLYGSLLRRQKDPDLEKLRRDTVDSILVLVAWAVGAWVLAYSVGVWITLDQRTLLIVQLLIVGAGIATLARQLVAPADKRWMPRAQAMWGIVAGVVLAVLTLVGLARS